MSRIQLLAKKIENLKMKEDEIIIELKMFASVTLSTNLLPLVKRYQKKNWLDKFLDLFLIGLV